MLVLFLIAPASGIAGTLSLLAGCAYAGVRYYYHQLNKSRADREALPPALLSAPEVQTPPLIVAAPATMNANDDSKPLFLTALAKQAMRLSII